MASAAHPQPIHIFRPGSWVSLSGEMITFSEADLAACARAYDPAKHYAPIVKGHPATDDPAQGWVEGLSIGAGGLYATPAKVDPAFAEEVKAGRFGTVSAKFYRPESPANPVPGTWYLRHLGFLGAHPPGVKGLQAPVLDPAFGEAANDPDCVTFAEGVAFGDWEDAANASLWRSLREWLLARFGLEEADKAIPKYDVAQLETAARRETDSASEAKPADFAEAAAASPVASPIESPTQKEPSMTHEEAQALRAQLAEKERQLSELQAQQAAAAAQAAKAESAAFAEGLVKQAHLPAAVAGQVAAIDAQLKTADAAFGEGADAKPLQQVFRDLLTALPPMTTGGTQASQERSAAFAEGNDVTYAEGADPERVALDKQVRAHMHAHNTDYASAFAAVTRR